jgi:hypothetical protein
MIENAISDTNHTGMRSLVQPYPPIDYTPNSGRPVTVRLLGQQSDIEAVVRHWCIEIESHAWPAVSQNQRECVVEGTLV